VRALPGTLYDGHTLAEALEHREILMDQLRALAVVDRRYRGHGGSYGYSVLCRYHNVGIHPQCG